MATLMFSKVLTESEVEGPMSYPSNCLDYLPPFEVDRKPVDFQAIDANGRPWSFVCSVPREGYNKAVLRGAWREFVASYELVVGDKVYFYVKQDPGTRALEYEVKVQKAVKLFGVPIGYAPMP